MNAVIVLLLLLLLLLLLFDSLSVTDADERIVLRFVQHNYYGGTTTCSDKLNDRTNYSTPRHLQTDLSSCKQWHNSLICVWNKTTERTEPDSLEEESLSVLMGPAQDHWPIFRPASFLEIGT